MLNEKDTIRKDEAVSAAEAKRHDAEEMIEIYMKLPEAARERIRYMTEGAALTVDHQPERAAV